MRPIALTLVIHGLLLSLVISWTSGSAVGPISDTGSPIFPRFSEPFDPSIWNVNVDDGPSARFRLPNQIVPRHYKLQIRPILEGDPNNFTAPGTVQITVECKFATDQLTLHAAELDINESSVQVWRTNDSAPLTVVNQTFNNDPSIQTYTIHVQEILTVGGSYDIYIEYVAKVAPPSQRMNGVYWSSYRMENGDTRYLATTQFSRTLAFRKTLPSFDEPSQKATFEITIGRENTYHSLSNMNLRQTVPIPEVPGWSWDIYDTTPVMSPTIIAFIVSDFANETAQPDLFHPDKPVKIWGPPAEIEGNGGVFAAEVAAKTLKYFEDYFGIEYELPKIDSAALPDFAAGAMENWVRNSGNELQNKGLNTYRIMYLIWKQGINTVAEKFRVANILGHELAHQYWGNLVTHAWWNDWWLTEGFASYYEYRSVEEYDPDFQAIDRLVTSDIQPALEFDSGPDSVPIHGVNSTHFVENPSTINYAKGAALVNMMRSFMTEQVFQQACSFYLRTRSYMAVHQDALFTDLTTYLTTNNLLPSNNKTINEIMGTWTLQTSFPLMRVSRAGPNHIFVSQERFENAAIKGQQEQTGLWHVPVFYISENNSSFDSNNNLPKFWMDKNSLLMMHEIDTNQWILVNPGGNGYYRVLYDDYLGNLLKTQLETTPDTIPIGSRSMIVDDYFAAAYQGYIPLTKTFDMVNFMSRETNFNVWLPYMKHLRKGYELFASNDAQFNVFKAYITQMMQHALNEVGFIQLPSELPMNTITRVQLFDWACPMFHPGCVLQANIYLDAWKANEMVNPIPVDIQPSMYCAATADDASGNWDFLMNQFNLNKDPLIRSALACTTSITKLESITMKVLDEDLGQAHVIGLLGRAAANSLGRPFVLNLLTNTTTFAQLLQPEKLGHTGVADVIDVIATYSSDLDTQTRLQTLATDNQIELDSVMNRINLALARFESNRQWLNDFGDTILAWMTPPP